MVSLYDYSVVNIDYEEPVTLADAIIVGPEKQKSVSPNPSHFM
jgi:hypothetical protein